MTPFSDLPPIVSVKMVEQMRLELRKKISAHEIAQYRFESWEDVAAETVGTMVLKVQRGLYGTEIHENEIDHRLVPKDWWQHFKLRWFPRWLERRFPVQMTRIAITLKHCHVCPHQDIPPNAEEHVLFLLNRKESDIEWITKQPKKPKPKEQRRILRNLASCNACGDVIESKHRHDWVECSCKATFVDGGKVYLRRGRLRGTE